MNLNSIMIGSDNPQRLSDFYQKVFHKKADMEDGDWHGYAVGPCFLMIGRHDKVKGKSKNPERVIWNFEVKDVQKEFARVKALGATVIANPYHPDKNNDKIWIATFADPDGNYFQLATPWE